jgi:hypothetical protein
MTPALLQIGGLEFHGAQLIEVGGAEAGEIIQTLADGHILTLVREAFAVKGIEGTGFAEFEDHFCAWHPVGAFAVDEVTDGVEGAPGFVAFVAMRPLFGKIAEQGIERGGGAGEESDGSLQIMWHAANKIPHPSFGQGEH